MEGEASEPERWAEALEEEEDSEEEALKEDASAEAADWGLGWA